MKHQAINSLKFKLLARRLGVPLWQAVGVLESIWLLAQFEAKDGDLTHYGASGVAAWIEWDGDADELLAALVETGWIDSIDGKLFIHDWADHRPNWIKGVDARQARRQQAKTVPEVDLPSTEPSTPLSTEPSSVPSKELSTAPSTVPPKALGPRPETQGGSTPPTPPPRVQGQMPSVLDTPEFRETLGRWIAYKGRKYRPKGLQTLLTRAANLASQHSLAKVIEAFDRAIANGWDGWDQASSFASPRASPPPPSANDKPRDKFGREIVPLRRSAVCPETT